MRKWKEKKTDEEIKNSLYDKIDEINNLEQKVLIDELDIETKQINFTDVLIVSSSIYFYKKIRIDF